ncbi:nectin-4-like [Sander lucioperca]|uniref:nectin-4-like n=1 Tax=Sander lucioperca TaxID=283035 RepID=UPI001653848B|nr:nectin-4-like [Sander lucioperca]
MAGLRSVLFTLWIVCLAGEDTKNITAKPGEDVPLHCQGPRDADIPGILWSRPDLGSDKYVFFFRGNRPYENYQLPSYSGRVNLSDPEIKDGDVSVVLRNVSINDTGTYECQVIIRGGDEPKHYSTIQLNVTVSDHTVGHTVGGRDTDGNLWWVVGVVVGGLVGVVVVGCIIKQYREHKRRHRGVTCGDSGVV